jgi:hypothetical protein
MTSTIKVNNVQNQCGQNIINENSNTITIGASGDTIALASGASQTGFGREGSVDWQTGSIKTGDFTAVSGEGYFINTTSGVITMTLPASPSAGDIVSIRDYAGTFNSNNLTIARNGSNLEGNAGNKVISTIFQNLTMVYVDGTEGWIATGSGSTTIGVAPAFIEASGGTETTSGDYKIHTFTSPGTFTVNSVGNPGGSTTVDYLVVAGGGGGGSYYGAGAGAGGARMSSGTTSGGYTVGPLGSGVSSLTVPATSYPITIGAGGATGNPCGPGSDGTNTVFSTITSTGGGGGAGNNGPAANGRAGGSGGGGTGGTPGATATGGAGNTPPVSPPQGNPGGGNPTPLPAGRGASGGGAGAAGTAGCAGGAGTTKGGIGIINNINPASGDPSGGSQYYAAGGNPSQSPGVSVPGALGGGGKGPGGPPTNGAGGANLGGGGGGNGCGSNGGSGIVIIRYKFQ